MASFKISSTASQYPSQKTRVSWWAQVAGVLLLGVGQLLGGEMVPMFDGHGLEAWKVPTPNPWWRVEQGVLIGENDADLKGNVLYTKKDYQDFVLEAEVKWEGEIDSGFMLRKPELQLQIGVSRSLKRDLTGSFYTGGEERYPEAGQAKGLQGLFKVGEWTRFRLQAKGDTFTVWINRKKVTEYTSPNHKDPGPIGLQIHGGLKMRVDFRNIRIQEL